jgi:hypothetical protein
MLRSNAGPPPVGKEHFGVEIVWHSEHPDAGGDRWVECHVG